MENNQTMIMEPLKEYNSHYKEQFKNNTIEYYDKLVQESNINIEENKETVKKIKGLNSNINVLTKRLDTFRKLRGFLSFLVVALFVAAGYIGGLPMFLDQFKPGSETKILYIFPFTTMIVLTLLYLISLAIKGDPKKSRTTRIVFQYIMIMWAFVPIIIRFTKYDGNKFKLPLIILLVIAGVAVLIDLIIKFVLIKREEKRINKEKDELTKKRDIEIENAYKQMAALNNLFDWNIPSKLVEKTLPIIKMDKTLDASKAEYLYQKYGFKVGDNNTSTVFMQSGTIEGNPFMLCKDYKMNMINKTYTGQITITWTTTIRVNGKTQTIPHVQVLTASVSAPAPNYTYDQYLVYGNEAAPDLSFSRRPNPMSSKSEKEIKKYVDKIDKKLTKKGEKALMNGGTYQKLGNSEFEALFGGTDRNNEVQYRLLFTPLAQKNLLNLMKTKEPFGDDFSLYKRNCLNYVRSYHTKNYSQDPTIFINYDYEDQRNFFINYNTKFFESFYFDLAPLLCIPIYQETKAKEFIYEEKLNANFSMYEYEQIANTYNQNLLKHPQSITGNIYKAERIETVGNTDRIKIFAHSFRGERRVTYCTKLGGDGKMHTIPVYWIQYFPVVNETEMLLTKADISRQEYNTKSRSEKFADAIRSICKGNAFKHEKNIFSLILAGEISSSAISDFNTNLDFAKIEASNDIDLTNLLKAELNETESANQKEGSDANVELQGEAAEVKEENLDKVEEVKEEIDPDLVDDEE